MFSVLLVLAGIWLLVSFVFVGALCLAASKGARQEPECAEDSGRAEPAAPFAPTVASLTH